MKVYQLFEEHSKPKEVVICFGRFNPPTKGHLENINNAIEFANKNNCKFFLILSKTEDDDKNPLTYHQKIKFIKQMISPDINIIIDEQIRTIVDIIKFVKKNNFEKMYLAVGDDRVTDMSKAMKKINKEMFWEIINTGKRSKGLSSSYARKYAKANDIENFLQLYNEDHHKVAIKIFAALRQYYIKDHNSKLLEYIEIHNSKEKINV